MAWRNLKVGHLRNISTKLFENRPDTFGEEDFLSFHYSHIRQNSPAHLAANVFRPINLAWRNLIEGHPRNIFTKLFENLPTSLGEEEVFFISLPWKPEFCMDPKNFKEFWWGHWEDAFCEVSSQLTHRLTHRLQRRGYRGENIDGRRTTDAGHRAITITHLEHFVHR